MADSQSRVEILLSIQAKKAELEAVREKLKGLNTDIASSQGATSKFNAELAASRAEQQRIIDVLTGVRTTMGKTAADFAPATAAQRAFSLRAEEAAASTAKAAINTAQLERNVILMTSGITRAIPGTAALGSEVNMLGRGLIGTSTQLGLFNTLLVGAGIGAALAFAAALAKIASTGVELQKTLQDVGEGVAGTLTTESTKFGGGDAQRAAVASMQQLVEVARQAQVPISELAKGFDQINPAATRANASINQQIQLIAQLTAQSGALHIPQQRLITDLEQIFNGNVRNTNQLVQRLGLDKQEVIQARENGTITDLLIQKEQEYAKAHEDGSTTIERAQQKVQAAWEQLALAATKPIVQPVTEALLALAAALNDPGIQAGVTNIVSGFEAIIAVAGRVISAMQAVGHAIVDALNAAASFAVKSAGMLPLGEGEGSQGGEPVGETGGGGPGGAIELPALTVLGRAPGLSAPPGGYPKGGGGRGGGKGPSQDVQDQQAISAIMSEVNEKQTAYNALVDKNNTNHKLGLTTLNQEQAANLAAGQTFLAAIDQEQAKLEAQKQKILDIGAAQGGLNDKETVQVNKLQQAIDKLDIMKGKVQLAQQGDSWIGQWQAGLIKLSDQFQLTGTKAAQFFGQSLTSGINATSTALTGLIFQTKNWQQAFISAGQSIVDQLIHIGLQAVIGSALSTTLHKADQLAAAKSAAAGAWSSAAQIPWFGWIIAPIAAAAAYAGAIAFEEGGIVPGGYSASDNRIALVRSGEGILTPSAVAAIGGPNVIHSLNQASPRFADGGVVGGGGIPNINLPSMAARSQTTTQHNIAIFQDSKALADWLRGREGSQIVVDVIRGKAHLVGIPSTIG
jgi:hypothetical protein